MALKSQNRQVDIAENPNSRDRTKRKSIGAATIITEGSFFEGNIRGNDSVHIDGYVKGNVIVDNGVIIGKNGIVDGNVEAHKVIVSGELNGVIICDELEIMNGALIGDSIEALNIITDGTIEGEVIAKESIKITANGYVKVSKLNTRSLLVDGFLEAKELSTQFLELTTKGEVVANMQVDRIKIHIGGKFVGTIKEWKQNTK